jgi:hypothetical protein
MSSSGPATLNMTASDAATCSGPQGPFSHIYVTITDIQVNATYSSSAGDNGPAWIDLTPQPAASAAGRSAWTGQQSVGSCRLRSTTELPPGSYQKIRIFLAGKSTLVLGNQCGGNTNCVMLGSDPTSTAQPLLPSSQAKTGLKIPSGQIARGRFVVATGKTQGLDIVFNACASIELRAMEVPPQAGAARWRSNLDHFRDQRNDCGQPERTSNRGSSAPSALPLSLSEESRWAEDCLIRHRANCRNQPDQRRVDAHFFLCSVEFGVKCLRYGVFCNPLNSFATKASPLTPFYLSGQRRD